MFHQFAKDKNSIIATILRNNDNIKFKLYL